MPESDYQLLFQLERLKVMRIPLKIDEFFRNFIQNSSQKSLTFKKFSCAAGGANFSIGNNNGRKIVHASQVTDFYLSLHRLKNNKTCIIASQGIVSQSVFHLRRMVGRESEGWESPFLAVAQRGAWGGVVILVMPFFSAAALFGTAGF